MIDFPAYPEVPFNPVVVPVAERLLPEQLVPGPLGLALFLPFIPFLRFAAQRYRLQSLLIFPVLWLFATLGPVWCPIFIGGTLFSAGWVLLLRHLRKRGVLGARGMIAAVWIGLNLFALPLWWKATWDNFGWPPGSPLGVFHGVGFAYVLLRLIAWGVEEARHPSDDVRPLETLCWLFYPPGLRNGPFLLRQVFFERLDAWDPTRRPPWGDILKHFGWALLGGVGIGVAIINMPQVAEGQADFLAAPQEYTTGELLRAFYFVPIVVYFVLWIYNQLALAYGAWVGIEVDTNFYWLPAATSVRDFWRRWNITVGAWIRNYIYIPLGGNKGWGPLMYGAAFGYCGIWHGAAWSFVAWPVVPIVAMSVQRRWDQFKRARGWDKQPASRSWTVFCWLLTMHLGALTVFIFADFKYMGLRLLGELGRRALASLTLGG